MGDGRLRSLERAYRETGSAEDEAAWLRERVRVGDLPGPQLELAAALGHEPARLALGPEGDWRGLAEVFSASSTRREHLEQAGRWARRIWEAAPGFARRTWLELAARTLKRNGQDELARRVRRASDGELKRLAADAERTLSDTNPARGICFELSDDQAEQLQRDMASWRRRRVGEHVLAKLPGALEGARQGSMRETQRELIERGLGPLERLVAWALAPESEPIKLVPPPSNPGSPRG